jgi:diaminohydroxyphosphoribosylaminopyrimidine deaminase/5-amino-6-(5-phosphoribosylamino)uracil reductase
MQAAIALAARSRGLSTPNPNVGCLIVKDGRVLGRGWTQAGGRPHAEAMALGAAGKAARGATAYVTLEPCAHESQRGPACADLLIAAGVARVVAALRDPDPRTDGKGLARLAAAGISVSDGVGRDAAMETMAGWWARATRGRAHVTLKLATSLDGCIALPSGESRWITGNRARAFTHLARSRCDAILVGRGTWETDRPALDVRLAGLESRSPRRLVLSASDDADAECVASPNAAVTLDGVNDLFVEGGAQTAVAFLAADLVDTLMIHRAPILIGGGRAALTDIGLASLNDAHGRWTLIDARQLGSDRIEHYQRVRKD